MLDDLKYKLYYWSVPVLLIALFMAFLVFTARQDRFDSDCKNLCDDSGRSVDLCDSKKGICVCK